AKILISGGGRCNVTHETVDAADFAGPTAPIRNVLAAFDAGAAVAWFRSLGVELVREETGKLFPATNRASTVLDALLTRCRALGVEIRPGHRVVAIERRTASEGESGESDDGGGTPSGVAGVADGADVGGGSEAGREPPRFVVRHERGAVTAQRVVLAT